MSESSWEGDGTAPILEDISGATSYVIRVEFSEDMTNNAALVLTGNYSVAGLTVASVVRINARMVDVTFNEPMVEGTNTLTVSGPQDLALNECDSSMVFEAPAQFALIFAQAIGRQTFLVTFSRPYYDLGDYEDHLPQTNADGYTGIETVDASPLKSGFRKLNWIVEDPDGDRKVVGVFFHSATQVKIQVVGETDRRNSFTISAENIYDVTGTDPLEDDSVSCVGFIHELQETLQLVDRARAPADYKNNAKEIGGFTPAADGGYTFSEGEDTLLKLFYRQLAARPDGFYHLGEDWGVGLEVKSEARSSSLINMRGKIENKLGQQKDVQQITVGIQVDPRGLVILNIRARVNNRLRSFDSMSFGDL